MICVNSLITIRSIYLLSILLLFTKICNCCNLIKRHVRTTFKLSNKLFAGEFTRMIWSILGYFSEIYDNFPSNLTKLNFLNLSKYLGHVCFYSIWEKIELPKSNVKHVYDIIIDLHGYGSITVYDSTLTLRYNLICLCLKGIIRLFTWEIS